MPIVKVDIPTGYDDAIKDELRQGIKDAIVEALDPGQNGRHPETCKWIYPSIHEAYGALGDGLPTVTVDTRPGRKYEQKRMLAHLICDLFDRVMGTRDVYVLLRTTDSEDHLAGGEPLPVWRPELDHVG
jgi:phenylpyruvate tautomerase PptA (4-oxalocrotonate tautomerase family)